MNWAEFQQQVSRWLYNFSTLFSFFTQYISSTPQDATWSYKKEDGMIENRAVPNIVKNRQMLWDDVGGALGQFNKIYYVDADNGDDTNSGKSNTPFKTIKKAIDAIPIGGNGRIYLQDGTHIIDENIKPNNKSINFYGSENAIVTHTVDTNKYAHSIKGKKTNITFYGCKIKTYSGELNSKGYDQCLIGRANSSGDMFVELYNTKIEINNAHIFQQSFGGGKLDLHVYISGKILGQGKLLDIEDSRGVATLGVESWSVTDSSNNDVSILNMVTGIARDADSGNPINFLSNINFSN